MPGNVFVPASLMHEVDRGLRRPERKRDAGKLAPYR
jgi:hypothetical protein